MTIAGKHHRNVMFISRFDHLAVSDRAAWLDDCSDAELGGFVDSVAKWKKGIRGKHRALHRNASPHRPYLHGIDPGHLSRTDTDRLAVTGVNDSIGLCVFAD